MLVHDGAYGTLLAHHVGSGETVDDLVVRMPQAVIDAHRSYIDAGVHGVQTNSFLAYLRASDRRRRRIVEGAVACAREAIALSGCDVQLFGTVGPAGREPRLWWGLLEELLEADVSGVLCETITDADIARACIDAWSDVARGVADVPLLLGCSVATDRGTDGWRWVADVAMDAPASVEVGLNCCAGPTGLRPALEALCAAREAAWCMPSAGIPVIDDDGRATWPWADADAWGEAAADLVSELPVTRVGGCCGTTPASIEMLGARS